MIDKKLQLLSPNCFLPSPHAEGAYFKSAFSLSTLRGQKLSSLLSTLSPSWGGFLQSAFSPRSIRRGGFASAPTVLPARARAAEPQSSYSHAPARSRCRPSVTLQCQSRADVPSRAPVQWKQWKFSIPFEVFNSRWISVCAFSVTVKNSNRVRILKQSVKIYSFSSVYEFWNLPIAVQFWNSSLEESQPAWATHEDDSTQLVRRITPRPDSWVDSFPGKLA